MSLEMKYFVLKPKSKDVDDFYAMASRSAMIAYADSINEVDEKLADELREWVKMEQNNAYALMHKNTGYGRG